MIYAARIVSGQERLLVNTLAKKAEKLNLKVYSIAYLKTVKGYLFIEAEEDEDVLKLTEGVRGIRSILESTVKKEELVPHLEKKEVEININKGDIVEFIKGGFRGEMAKVIRVDKEKNEIVVEPLDVAVSIPITTKMSSVRVVKREGEE